MTTKTVPVDVVGEHLLAGPALDLLVAERVMRWTWYQAPQHDYDGPLPQQGKVLVPPGFTAVGFAWPPRGVIPPGYFCGRFKPSTDIGHAFEVVPKVPGFFLYRRTDGTWTAYGTPKSKNGPRGNGSTAPLAICRLALLVCQ